MIKLNEDKKKLQMISYVCCKKKIKEKIQTLNKCVSNTPSSS